MSRATSKTALETFLNCPMQYWFHYFSGLPKKTDFPRVMGIAVHRFLAKLHEKHSGERPFFFKSKQSAISSWFGYYWRTALEEFSEQLGDFPQEKAETYGRVGWFCINNYWERMSDSKLGAVLESEKTYTHQLSPGVKLTGKLDQVRSASLEYIESFRPELVVNGRLQEGYLPYFILDFKTGRFDFDPRRAGENNPTEAGKATLSRHLAGEFSLDEEPILQFLEYLLGEKNLYLRDYTKVTLPDLSDPAVLLEILRMQTAFRLGIQETMYTFLFEQKWQKKPVGFLLYNLHNDTVLPTYRDENDYEDLFSQVGYFKANVQAGLYPKIPGMKCQRCDYCLECLGEERSFISIPVDLPDTLSLLPVEVSPRKPEPEKQMKMKISIPREKANPPQAAKTEQLSFESMRILGQKKE
jgi:hypothetical protein